MKGIRLNQLPTVDASAPVLFTASKSGFLQALLCLLATPFFPSTSLAEQNLFPIQS